MIDFLKEGEKKIEYRAWNSFRFKLVVVIFGGVDKIYMKFGFKVLYLGVVFGIIVSYVSDIVGLVSINILFILIFIFYFFFIR